VGNSRQLRSKGWRTLRRLADLPGVAGVKQAVGGIDEDTVRLMAGIPDRFAVLAGEDVFTSALFAEPNPTIIKAVLHAQGRIPSAAVRLPLLAAGRATVSAALAVLRCI